MRQVFRNPNTGGNKYHNKKVEFAGIKFDSEREMKRYLVLKDAEAKGIISNLECHPKYELLPAVKHTEVIQLKTKTKEKEVTDQLAITYTADFRYQKNGETVVEDVKISEYMLPKEYILKEKMMFYFHHVKIKRIYKPTAEV